MASAILVNRSEHHWGEGRLCTKNNHNSNSRTRCPNPNPNLHDQIFDCLSQIHGGSNSELANDIPSDDSSSLNWKSIGSSPRKDPYVELVKFNVAGYTRRELKELKKRLVCELEQVRVLINRIDSNDFTESNGSKEKPFPKKTNKHPQTLEFGNKIVSGTKRPNPSDSNRESKRGVAEIGSGKLYPDTMKICEQILTKLMKTKCSWIFNIPVDAAKLQLHDYHQIIKNPMDLGTIKEKLEKNLYKSPNDFACDVRLTFDNAMLYNPRGHDVYRFAEQLLGKFEELFNSLCAKYNLEQRSMTKEEKGRNQCPATPVIPEKSHVDIPAKETTQSIVPVLKQSTGRQQPKPKAKNPNKREMTYEEKQKLGLSLQDLQQEKLDQVVQIIQRRNSNVPENGNEIELDLDIMDTETLWELDRFVCNCKKAMSKNKRQSLADGRTSVAMATASQETIHGTKLQDNQEEDVDIGEDMPTSDFPPVEIEKDDAIDRQSSSSGSSTSDSSSSSSDSDSESSSNSDSDGDDKKSPFVGSKISPRT